MVESLCTLKWNWAGHIERMTNNGRENKKVEDDLREGGQITQRMHNKMQKVEQKLMSRVS